MWQSFLGGAAWALLAGGRSEPVHCHCTCECQPSTCPESSWLVEILKVVVWIAVGLFLQSFKLLSWVWDRTRPCLLTSDQSHPQASTAESTPGLEDIGVPSGTRIEKQAREQLLALRRKQAERA